MAFEDNFKLDILVPVTWAPYDKIPSAIRGTVLAPDTEDASFTVNFGEIVSACSLKDIAESPVQHLSQQGASIPVVMSFPILRQSEPAHGHMCNFPAILPGALVGRPDIPEVGFFKYITVVPLEGFWFSIETAAWGVGCDPAVEITKIGDIHSNFVLKKA